MNNEKGVLIIALGHAHYGQMAANLALSIKFKSPEIPIKLVWAENALSHLAPDKLALFDEIEECPHAYYHRKDGKRVYVQAKTHMYDLSPFKETIFIDADVIMCPRKTIAQAFEMLKDVDFTMENRSKIDLSKSNGTDFYQWANVKDVIAAYGKKGFLYGLHSEFVYFKRCQKMRTYFATVKKIFANPVVKPVTWDGDIPDEFAFAMAMIKHDIYPHKDKFVPLYWYLTDKALGTTLEFVHSNYFGYSIGGNNTPDQVKRKYNQMARAYARKLNVQHPWKVIAKRIFAQSRIKM